MTSCIGPKFFLTASRSEQKINTLSKAAKNTRIRLNMLKKQTNVISINVGCAICWISETKTFLNWLVLSKYVLIFWLSMQQKIVSFGIFSGEIWGSFYVTFMTFSSARKYISFAPIFRKLLKASHPCNQKTLNGIYFTSSQNNKYVCKSSLKKQIKPNIFYCYHSIYRLRVSL